MTQEIPSFGLKEGEKVLWHGNRTLASYIGRIAAGIVLIILVGLFYGLWQIVGGPWWFFIPALLIIAFSGFGLILSAMIGTIANHYYVTNMRVIHEYTFVSKSIRETTLDKITDIVFRQGFIDRSMNIGYIHFHTAGTGFPGINFEGIKDPVMVRGLVINAKDEYKKESKIKLL